MQKKDKIIVILGPTASGKTEWGIRIAKKFNGEVISADSRTVYRHLDIGTAKPEGKKCRENQKFGCLIVKGIKHYLLDFVDPKKEKYTLAEFLKDALALVKKIQKSGKIPIIVGGTALYIYGLLEGYDLPKTESERVKEIRRELGKRNREQLWQELKDADPESTEFVDKTNKRRIIRALEVCRLSGQKFSARTKSPLPYSILKIAIKRPREEIYRRIDKRTRGWFGKKGIIWETKRLLRLGVSRERINEIGLGYREVFKYLKGEIKSQKELEEKINYTQHAYVRRQMTWFRKDKKVKWLKSINMAEKLVEDFLKND